jgi:hypothetical protein
MRCDKTHGADLGPIVEEPHMQPEIKTTHPKAARVLSLGRSRVYGIALGVFAPMLVLD